MTTEFIVGDKVTMSRKWLRSTASYFDSPFHHAGEVTALAESEHSVLIQRSMASPRTSGGE